MHHRLFNRCGSALVPCLAACVFPLHAAAFQDAAPSAETAAAGVDHSRIEASIRDQWRRAAGFPEMDGLVFHWRLEDSYVPPADKLEAFRATVRSNPGDPHASELAEYERRLAEGTPLVRRFSFRARNDRNWRLCQNAGTGSAAGEVAFIDCVLTDHAAWKLTPTWLVLIDPSKPMPDGHPIPDVGAFFMHDLFMLLDGGMRDAARVGARIAAVEEDGGRWRCQASDSEKRVGFAFDMRWDDAARRALVERLAVTGGEEQGSHWEFSGWTLDPEADLWMAGRAERIGADGRLQRALILENVRREPSGAFDEATKAPWFDKPDALRGGLALKSVTDFASEQPAEIVRTSHGVLRTPLSVVKNVSRQGERNYRRLGWGLAGLTAVALVFVRLRRGHGAAASSSPFILEKQA